MRTDLARDVLVQQADLAYLALASHVSEVLDVCHEFIEAEPADHWTLVQAHKVDDLQGTFKPLASLMLQLGDVLQRWKHREPRVLSRLGVECSLLNELFVQLDAIAAFFARNGNSSLAEHGAVILTALNILKRTNRIVE